MTPTDKLQRCHAFADNAIYAAEVECGIVTGRGSQVCNHPNRPCPFKIETIPSMKWCKLPALRALLGDHYSIKQERDIPQEIHKGIQFINDVFWGPGKR